MKLRGWEIARGVSGIQAVKKVRTPNAVFLPRSKPQLQAAELVAAKSDSAIPRRVPPPLKPGVSQPPRQSWATAGVVS